MAIDTEPKRWSMMALAGGPPRIIVINPETNGLSSIEKITVLQHYGGIAWENPAPGSAWPLVDGGIVNRGLINAGVVD